MALPVELLGYPPMAGAIAWLAYRLFAKSVSKKTFDEECARLTALNDAGYAAREKLRAEKDAALAACEGRSDDLEKELRGMYERMLDTAYAVHRGGNPRPHRGKPEPLEARRERLRTVTMELTEEERIEYAARLGRQLVAEPDPPTL